MPDLSPQPNIIHQQPDGSREFAVSVETSIAADGKHYAFSLRIAPDVYGVGDTADEALVNFMAVVEVRYNDLRAKRSLTLSEARELEYLSARGGE